MTALMRQMDWSETLVGPIESWPQSLRLMVSFLQANRFPLMLWWGPQFCQFYNDAYQPMLGTKHPRSLGQPARECWSEIWHITGPLIETPFNGGPATLMEDICLELNRYGFLEETHFTIGYSPVPDETALHGIGGVLATVHEITDGILAERRSAALRNLGRQAGEAKTVQEACAAATEILAHHPQEVPFALLYLIDADGQYARLAGSTGVDICESGCPVVVELKTTQPQDPGWSLFEAVRSETMIKVDDLDLMFSSVPPGPWSDRPNCAVVVPVRSHTAHQIAGLLVAGVSARLNLDGLYRSFFEFAATQIATTLATARAHEEERTRADLLAEIAKTTAIATARAHEDERTRAEGLAEIARATAVGTARAHEEERSRAEALAEIARATAVGTARAREDERKRADSLAQIAEATAIATARAHEDERNRAEALAEIAKATAIGTTRAREDERRSADSLAEIAKATAIATARAHEDERKSAESLAEIAKATAIATARAHEDERKSAEALAEIAKATAIATARAHEDERKAAEALAEIARATAIGTARAHDDERKSAEALAEIAKATAIGTARAHEDERERAEALADIAKAKTTFFANVSHEFRTPLTLMLGPLDEVLTKTESDGLITHRPLIKVAHRNGLRLLKLVNTLLEFSRIEAGRVQGSFAPVDLARMTSELTSNFSFACERAGLSLKVDCPPIGEPVYVDHDMWEKIVLNLLSNAFKFTLEGEIGVSLRHDNDYVTLSVTDTGTGVRDHEIPHLFERFHRVEGAHGRTDEGSGIGLALVQELAKLHGGTVQIASTYGIGSTFTVRVPLGAAHLPSGQVWAASSPAFASLGAHSYVEEALRWLPDAEHEGLSDNLLTPVLTASPAIAGVQFQFVPEEQPMILLADDNADMRDYIIHVLSADFRVSTVGDGEAALAVMQRSIPDLLLTDVMMPRLDGFDLLRAVRADPVLADLPVVLLSAHAGAEAKIEGLEAQADDYIVKPFSARELIGRVHANLELARLRGHRKRVVAERAKFSPTASDPPSMIAIFDNQGFAIDMNFSGRQSVGLGTVDDARRTQLRQYIASSDTARLDTDLLPAIVNQGRWAGALTFCNFKTSRPLPMMCNAVRINDLSTGRQTYLGVVARSIDPSDRSDHLIIHTRDQLQSIVNDAPMGIYMVDGNFRLLVINPTALPAFGDLPALIGRDFEEIAHLLWPQAYADEIVRRFRFTLATGQPFKVPGDIEERHDQGITEFHEWHINRVPLPDGHYGVVCYFRDVSAQILARKAIAASERRTDLSAKGGADMIFTAAPNGEPDYAATECSLLTGLLREQIKDSGWAHFLHPADVDDTAQAWKLAVATRQPFRFTHRLRRYDGIYRWHLSQAHLMVEADGTLLTWLGSSTDIHEQQEMENALQELSDILERKVMQRKRELAIEIQARQKAEATLQQAKRLETIGHLTGGIAHDFNNVLAAVLGNIELAMRRAPNMSIEPLLQQAQQAAERGAKLTSHLLSFARKQPLHREQCDVNLILAGFNDLLKRTIGPSVEVSQFLEPGLWPVIADATQFEMALLNLAMNARDAMPTGGTLTISTSNIVAGSPELPSDLAPGDYVYIGVQDNGLGMNEAVVAQAFDPFFTTKDLGKGTGLGLSQAYGFCKQLDGTATLFSEPGVGTRVGLMLPRAVPCEVIASLAQAVTIEMMSASRTGIRILVIDDEPEVREVVEDSLFELGFNVVSTESGRLGLEILRDGPPVAAVIVDFAMPVMDGLEFIHSVRLEHPNLPCLLVTDYTETDKLSAASSSGITILWKPYRINDLAEAIKHVVGTDTESHVQERGIARSTLVSVPS